MPQVNTKELIAAINAAGWTPEQVAAAIKAPEDDVKSLLAGRGSNLDSDATVRFERWAGCRIGYSGGGLYFDRPPAPMEVLKVIAPPVIAPDDYVHQSAINTTLTDLGANPRSQSMLDYITRKTAVLR
jgi:hypothetical protein